MSKLVGASGRTALLGALLLSVSAVYVEAICGECYLSHSCISNRTFRICYDGVPNPEHTFDCPADKPICSMFGDICVAQGSTACGDTSNCAQCSDNQIYACDSQTTFGRCDNRILMPERSKCPPNWFCSVTGAAIGSPCVSTCSPADGDTCERVDTTESNPPSTTPDPTTTTTSPTTPDPTTTTTTTTATTTSPATTTPPLSAVAYCQNIQRAGRYAIPNDTACTSFINCFFRSSAWQGNIVNCTLANPYFNAASTCGTVKPTTAGCL